VVEIYQIIMAETLQETPRPQHHCLLALASADQLLSNQNISRIARHLPQLTEGEVGGHLYDVEAAL
jgi:hypothetical protein